MSAAITPDVSSVPRTIADYGHVSWLAIESFPVAGPNGLPDRWVSFSGTHPEILLALDRREVNLAILHWDLPEHLTGSVLTPLLAAAPFTAVAKGEPVSIPDQLARLLPAPAPADLLQDIEDLAAMFSILDRYRGDVRVRLQAQIHKGRTHWHADFFGLRMLCTHRGQGTERLSLEGGAEAAERPSRVRPPSATGQIPIGAVAVMKDEGHPDTRGSACIHRSPWDYPGLGARLLPRIDQPDGDLDE